MTTRWRCWLAGDDQERLAAVSDWWAEEIDRWDQMLSRFDPASEVTRLNRAPVGKRLRVHRDLLNLLDFCEQARQVTQGLFDITASSLSAQDSPHVEPTPPFQLEREPSLFHWTVAGRQLDFGGVAKGYLLDQLAPTLREHGVTAALLDAGGSSLLTWDDAGDESHWQVSLAHADEDPSLRLLTVDSLAAGSPARSFIRLSNSALSYSATRPGGTSSGQTIDPRGGRELPESRACVVITESAAWAEVLSTAALCMGVAAAAKYIKER